MRRPQTILGKLLLGSPVAKFHDLDDESEFSGVHDAP